MSRKDRERKRRRRRSNKRWLRIAGNSFTRHAILGHHRNDGSSEAYWIRNKRKAEKLWIKLLRDSESRFLLDDKVLALYFERYPHLEREIHPLVFAYMCDELGPYWKRRYGLA
ncbi:MAG: hypothetical protein QGG50_07155 [Methanopyri archaeon]|jgi:hypothetical protein|nr:hypothetical protein [Methanopyri archaeon]